jgi:putative ABC transport system permease protein
MDARRTGLSDPPSYRLGDDGVVLTEQVARQFNVAVGDQVSLRNLEGDAAAFTVTGIVENYTMHYCYMTSAVYQAAYGESPQPNRVFVLSRSGNGELPASLLEDETVLSVTYTAKRAADIDTQLDVLTFVVVILIISAGVLIFVVLFSLNTINIEERRRELASIKVLGFYDRESADYIYRENVILTVAGAIVGLGLGFLLQRYIITTLEIDMFMFSRSLLWTSYAAAIALTFLFAAVVNLIMYPRLTQIDMVEALKAVE